MASASPPAVTALPQPTMFGSKLVNNTAWNIAGQVAPLVVGVAVLPLLIRTMGLDRYGFLTLAWVLVGYASVFDFGIGRALIRVVALRLSRGDDEGAQHVARVGSGYLVLFGIAVGAVFALASAAAVNHLFNLPPGLEHEALRALWLLSASLPFVMLTTAYVGVLSAHQQFRGVNILRAALGIASYVGPLLVVLQVNRLDAAIGFILLMRVLATAAHAALAAHTCHYRFVPTALDGPTSSELLAVGGWMSVSNIVGPLLSYLDRLLLGALLPMRMVAFYATPFDLTSKAMILPYSLMTAVFPTAAAVVPGTAVARRLLAQSVRLLFVLVFPIAFGLVVIARPALGLWLGQDFSAHAAPAMQLLAVGILLSALAQGPAMLIQAAGRPRVMALLHLTELPLFVGMLYALTTQFGIVGTALAAVLRTALDGLAVLLLARREMALGPIDLGGAIGPALMATVLIGAAMCPTTWAEALILLSFGLLVSTAYSWRYLLSPTERMGLRGLIGGW